MRPLKELWEVYAVGDHLEDSELDALIESAIKGIEYLEARGEGMALVKSRMDLNRLVAYQEARQGGLL